MREDYKRKMAKLWGLILIAVLYGGLLFWLRTLTGYPHTDGVIGVILGLYVCSHPAANAVDLLFFQQYPLKQLTAGWSSLAWLALNIVVFIMGWLMIAAGMTRLAH